MALRCALIIEPRPLATASPRRKTASGGLKPIPRHRLSRCPSQPHTAPWKNRLRYDFARRGAVLPQSGPCAVPGPRNVLNKAIAEANAKRLDASRRINEAIRKFGTKEAYPIIQGINIETSLWFIERVRTKGVWDFKNQPGTRGNQDFGNFAFGATADALGSKPNQPLENWRGH